MLKINNIIIKQLERTKKKQYANFLIFVVAVVVAKTDEKKNSSIFDD
jgi:hypothetical protein